MGPADVDATAHVYLDRLDDHVVVGGNDGHHLVRARRLRVAASITAADGHGRWRAYRVVAIDAGTVSLEATGDIARETPLTPGLSVACALTKGEKPELVVQKLTELGVDSILLVRAARSVVRWDATREHAAVDRLRRVAREAGAQSRRARLPVLDGPVPVAAFAGRRGIVVADRRGVPADELPLPDGGEWVVAVGPEGGFDEAELALLAGSARLALGPHVLRAETAAIAAAAALTWRRSQLA